jgi:hypothetical protein
VYLSPAKNASKTPLAILIKHGLMSRAAKTWTRDRLSKTANKFIKNASRKVKIAKAFVEFCMRLWLVQHTLILQCSLFPDHPCFLIVVLDVLTMVISQLEVFFELEICKKIALI